jgi:preprotein translocase subunit SecG
MLEILQTPVTVLHVVVCLFVVLVVLLQPGKSGGIGAALGGAGAQQVFGGRGAGNFLSRITWIAAGVFFATSMILAYISSSTDDSLARKNGTQAVVTPVKKDDKEATPEERQAAYDEQKQAEEAEEAKEGEGEPPAAGGSTGEGEEAVPAESAEPSEGDTKDSPPATATPREAPGSASPGRKPASKPTLGAAAKTTPPAAPTAAAPKAPPVGEPKAPTPPVTPEAPKPPAVPKAPAAPAPAPSN